MTLIVHAVVIGDAGTRSIARTARTLAAPVGAGETDDLIAEIAKVVAEQVVAGDDIGVDDALATGIPGYIQRGAGRKIRRGEPLG